MRKRDGVIVWPAYLDSSLPRAKGRKVPKHLGAPNVTLKILAEAAKLAKFQFEVEPDKLYPRTPRDQQSPGYIVVTNPQGHKKKRVMLMLAKGVRKIVAQQEALRQAKEKRGKKKKKRKR